MQVVKGPVTKYLPSDAVRIAMSHKAPEVKNIFDVMQGMDETVPIVFVVGAFAHGSIDVAYVDRSLSISHYPLSAAQVLTRITNACEQKFNIL
jgi:rRNA small subunit pseudouridine methyltransferase Nep1